MRVFSSTQKRYMYKFNIHIYLFICIQTTPRGGALIMVQNCSLYVHNIYIFTTQYLHMFNKNLHIYNQETRYLQMYNTTIYMCSVCLLTKILIKDWTSYRRFLMLNLYIYIQNKFSLTYKLIPHNNLIQRQ